jgi:hypothetical protein
MIGFMPSSFDTMLMMIEITEMFINFRNFRRSKNLITVISGVYGGLPVLYAHVKTKKIMKMSPNQLVYVM